MRKSLVEISRGELQVHSIKIEVSAKSSEQAEEKALKIANKFPYGKVGTDGRQEIVWDDQGSTDPHIQVEDSTEVKI
mgnify:CR=1 FL=1|jgi:hypothetical protein